MQHCILQNLHSIGGLAIRYCNVVSNPCYTFSAEELPACASFRYQTEQVLQVQKPPEQVIQEAQELGLYRIRRRGWGFSGVRGSSGGPGQKRDRKTRQQEQELPGPSQAYRGIIRFRSVRVISATVPQKPDGGPQSAQAGG